METPTPEPPAGVTAAHIETARRLIESVDVSAVCHEKSPTGAPCDGVASHRVIMSCGHTFTLCTHHAAVVAEWIRPRRRSMLCVATEAPHHSPFQLVHVEVVAL